MLDDRLTSADPRPRVEALAASGDAYMTAVARRMNGAAAPVDPWAFKEWLVGADGEADGGDQPGRNVLLHELFPETFEAISMPAEKQAIADALGALADADDRHDVDQTLYGVRRRLEALAAEGTIQLPAGVDFYAAPLRETWDAGEIAGATSSATGLSHLDTLRHKRQVVLYGPPGTGKTYEAKALADRLIRAEAIRRWGPIHYLRNRERVGELVRQQVRRRQLHQAYSYEDFVVGLRVADNGETEPYRGDLLQLIDELRHARVTSKDPEPLPWVLILDEINRTDLSRLLGEAFSALDDRDAQIELPAVGGHQVEPFKLPVDLYFVGTMNTIDQSVEQLDFALRRRFFWLHSGYREHMIAPVVRQRWKALDLDDRPWLRPHTWEHVRRDVDLLADRATALNAAIAASPLLGADYELGHTYFFEIVSFIADQPRLRSSRTAPGHYLWASDGRPLQPLVDLWTHALAPLLADYLAGLDGGARTAQLHHLESVFLAPASDAGHVADHG